MSPWRAWRVAARPRTLPAAITPVIVGSSLAAGSGFRFDVLAVTLFAALAIQVAVNFANDVADARTGADGADRIGPPRAVAGRLLTARQVWRGTWVAFGLAALAGLYLAWVAGWVIIAIGVVSIAAALGYTNGPVPYGYYGLGELFVFVFFGLVATVGSNYVQEQATGLDAWLLAVPVGMLITAILVANNVRDLDTDAAAGKRTLAVILGRRRTRGLFTVLMAGAFALLLAYLAVPQVPLGASLGLLAAPLAVAPVRAVLSEVAGPPLVAALEATARVQLAFGVLVATGIAVT